MSDPTLPLTAAIVSALTTSSPPVLAHIYDKVTPAATFPYVSIGPIQVIPDKADCIDGTEVFIQLDIWSQTASSVEEKQISAAIVAALDDQDLTVSGYRAVIFQLQDINHLRDPDGLTWHGVLNMRALMELA